MERRDFFLKTSILTAFAGVSASSFGQPVGSPLQGLLNTVGSPVQGPLNPVLLPSQPPLPHNGGMDIRVWVRSAMTNGLYSSVETSVAPKLMGPPPHYHKELDELMYVVEGTASILIGDDFVHVEAGGWHLRPRMLKHTFFNASDKPLRFFDMYFNQPFEEYLEKIFHELTAEKGYPEGSEAKNREMAALNEKFGLVFPENSFSQRTEIMSKFGLK
jgi:mannose-6-phosphate isomerase-like protein (cupin superfamily)